MDCTVMALLSRSDIERELKERQLNIAILEPLSYSDLLRIYRSFAVPLAKRERNNKTKNNVSSDKTGTIAPLINSQESIEIQEVASVRKMDDDMLDTHVKDIKTLNKIRKRTHTAELNKPSEGTTEEILSTATKRIKITWP